MDQQLILHVMNELGAGPQHLQQRVQTQPTYELACKALEELKADARKQYKKLAFEWHPDRNPDDAEAELKFKALGRIIEDLDKLKLRQQQPRQQVMHVHFPQTSPFGGTGTVTTGTPFTGWHPMHNGGSSATSRPYNARRVVFIRFR